MTRNGKIARLPADLRTELNQRLANGEMIKPLAEWLNGLPKVQEVMQKSFEGRPINEDNISEWKNGGYRDWEASQRMGEQVMTFQTHDSRAKEGKVSADSRPGPGLRWLQKPRINASALVEKPDQSGVTRSQPE